MDGDINISEDVITVCLTIVFIYESNQNFLHIRVNQIYFDAKADI